MRFGVNFGSLNRSPKIVEPKCSQATREIAELCFFKYRNPNLVERPITIQSVATEYSGNLQFSLNEKKETKKIVYAFDKTTPLLMSIPIAQITSECLRKCDE